MNNVTSEATGHERRHFIRHPACIPVTCRKVGHIDEPSGILRDISHGGLQFSSRELFAPGDVVKLEFPSLHHEERIRGEILWTCDAPDDPALPHDNGMRFLHDDMHYRARLVEQICHIEAYRNAQEAQGRIIGHEEAAEEWIARCAARFSDQLGDEAV